MPKMVHYEKFNFENIYGLQDSIMNMTDAVEMPIHIKNVGKFNEYEEYETLTQKPEFWNKDFKAILNAKTMLPVQVCTDSYQVLQHRDFFSMIPDFLLECGINKVNGYILEKNYGDSYTMRVTFDDFTITEPKKGDNIALGIEFRNSFNKMFAVSGCAWLLRLTCLNGATMESLIPESDFSRNHNAPNKNELFKAVSKKVERFIKVVLNSGDTINHLIDAALNDEIIFNDPRQLYASMEEIFETKKHAEAIADLVRRTAQHGQGDNLITNRWELYNAVTFHTSHNPMTPDIMSKILRKAETRILDTEGEIPLPLPVPVH